MSNVFDCFSGLQASVSEKIEYLLDLKNSNNVQDSDIINGKHYETAIIIEEIDTVVRIIRKNWFHIQSVVVDDSIIGHDELIKSRSEVNKCLKAIISCLKCCGSDQLKQRYLHGTLAQMKALFSIILPIPETEDSIFLKLTNSSSKDKCPIYHYFHTFLDVQYYLLLLHNISGNSDEIKNCLNSIVSSLVGFSAGGFKSKHNSAFVCDCNRNVWIMIQVYCENSFGDDTFWQIFNKTVENDKNHEFVLWMLQQVAHLHCYDTNGKHVGVHNGRIKPNFSLLETLLKQIFISVQSTGVVLSVLRHLQPLTCDTWLKFGKIEIYQLLWDYFSKRLKVSERGPNFTVTTAELVDLIDAVLWRPDDGLHDFELFLSMLTTHLSEHPYHWGKMKGRIYSQLGPNKLKELNTSGTFHVLLLFICLTKINFEDLSKKFQGFVESLPSEKKQTQMIWSFYAAFMMRHVRENRSLESAVSTFIKLAEEASMDHNLSHLLKSFVTDFDVIIKSGSNLQLHQWLLINTWLHHYMTSCYYPDLLSLLNVLLSTLERVNKEQVWCEWESSFKQYVYPTLKSVTGSRTAPEISGVIAGKIATLCPSIFSNAFTFFNADTISAKVSASFLCVVLDNQHNSLTPQQETIILQTWTKFCLLTRDGYEDLTRNLVKLDLVPKFAKAELAQAKDPLCSLIELVGSDVRQHLQTGTVPKLCEILFGQADRWIVQYLTQPENEVIILRIYTVVGLAFYKIGPLLYNKHKANCSYAKLVSALLLPTELMVGKGLNPQILQAVRKTWHLFFAATVRLNTSNDAFLDRILREMVVRYVPQFATADSPLIKALDNEVTAETVLEKMSVAFFAHPTKEAESNVFKSLRIVNDFVQATTSATLLKLVVTKTLHGLCEVVMFHSSQRNMALSAIKNITQSPLYSEVKSDFDDVLVAITEKHLAFNTPNYFQLIGNVAKLIPSDIKTIVPRIKQKVVNVERMRGVGYDKTLRLNLERLEASLLQML